MAYRPRIEGLFAQIEHWIEESTGYSYWRVIDPNNVTSILGKTENARIVDPENPERVFQWLLQETFDAKGNHIIYEYKSENTENVAETISELNRTQTSKKFIKTIKYGNISPFSEGQTTQQIWLFEVVFDYGEYKIDNPYIPIQTWAKRQDSFSTYHAGFEIRTHRLCQQIGSPDIMG